jgi:hypothetical protein
LARWTAVAVVQPKNAGCVKYVSSVSSLARLVLVVLAAEGFFKRV